jgi:hypothetical protein
MTYQICTVRPNPVAARAGSPQSVVTAAELAVLQRPDLLLMFDEKAGLVGDSDSFLEEFATRFVRGGVVRKLLPDGTNLPPKVVPSTDGRRAVLCGYPSIGGSNYAGDTHRFLIGQEGVDLPATAVEGGYQIQPFQLFVLAQVYTGSSGALWFAGSSTGGCDFEFTADNRARFYRDRVANDVTVNSDAEVNPGDLRVWGLKYSGTSATVMRGSTDILIGNETIPTLTSPRLLFGCARGGGGTLAFGLEGLIEGIFLFTGNDSAPRNAVLALAAERHPAMVLT